MSNINFYVPSGLTIQQKISENMRHWRKEITRRLNSGEKKETIRADMESRIRNCVKTLADKSFLWSAFFKD